MIANPTQPGQHLIAGFPVRIATQMPDVAPGATPVLFGNLQAAYLLAAGIPQTNHDAPGPIQFGILHTVPQPGRRNRDLSNQNAADVPEHGRLVDAGSGSGAGEIVHAGLLAVAGGLPRGCTNVG